MLAFIKPGSTPFMPKVPPITMGKITDTVILRSKVAAGIAKPSEVEQFKRNSVQRQKNTPTEPTIDRIDALLQRSNSEGNAAIEELVHGLCA